MLQFQSSLRTLVSPYYETLVQLDCYATHLEPFLELEIRSPEDEIRATEMLSQTFVLLKRTELIESMAIEVKGAKLLKDIEVQFLYSCLSGESLHLPFSYIPFQCSRTRSK